MFQKISVLICLLFYGAFSQAALINNGGGLIYDDVLNITWSQPDTTLRNWVATNTWVTGLTLGGVSNWRLPYISVTAKEGPTLSNIVYCDISSELECRDNELGYMFYHNLSGTRSEPILSSSDPNLALFPKLQSDYYWTGTEATNAVMWITSFNFGTNTAGDKTSSYYGWAVHAGNISPVPISATVWLFGSGLFGLIGVARRRDDA